MSSTMTVMNTSRSKLARDALGLERLFQRRGVVSSVRLCAAPMAELVLGISVAQEVQSSRVPGPVEFCSRLCPDGNSVTSNPCAAQWLSKSSNVNLPTNWCAHAGSCNRIFATPCATGVWIGCQSICVPGSPSQTAKKERHPRRTHANNAMTIAKDTLHGEGSEESPDDHTITFHTPGCVPDVPAMCNSPTRGTGRAQARLFDFPTCHVRTTEGHNSPAKSPDKTSSFSSTLECCHACNVFDNVHSVIVLINCPVLPNEDSSWRPTISQGDSPW